MNAVVVYESLYGNTHEIAKAVADGLRSGGEATVLSVADASGERLAGAELVVVGGPTHVHGMASRLSRKGAADDARKKGHELPDIEGPALRDWFDGLPKADGTPAATFDTRIDKPRFVTGSAAKGIARRLRSHRYSVGEESFLVSDSEGPLIDGELDRAREWGRSLARAGAVRSRRGVARGAPCQGSVAQSPRATLPPGLGGTPRRRPASRGSARTQRCLPRPTRATRGRPRRSR
jgi:Flavodoxin domain